MANLSSDSLSLSNIPINPLGAKPKLSAIPDGKRQLFGVPVKPVVGRLQSRRRTLNGQQGIRLFLLKGVRVSECDSRNQTRLNGRHPCQKIERHFPIQALNFFRALDQLI